MFFKGLVGGCFVVLTFAASWRSKIAKEIPEIAQRRPKRLPRRPQDSPRGTQAAQEASKTVQDSPKTALRRDPDRESERTFRAFGPRKLPGDSKKRPGGPQDAARSPRRAPKMHVTGARQTDAMGHAGGLSPCAGLAGDAAGSHVPLVHRQASSLH